jgi:hypothetical protein
MQHRIRLIFSAFIFLFVGTSEAFGDDDEAFWMADKRMVILQSTKSYASAKKTAKRAAKKLGLKLKLRGLVSHPKSGLTESKALCMSLDDGYPGHYPCYWPRGRWDDGAYISIEYSTAIRGFRDGYYIVVAASDYDGSALIERILKKARRTWKDAYAKKAEVYMGCIH